MPRRIEDDGVPRIAGDCSKPIFHANGDEACAIGRNAVETHVGCSVPHRLAILLDSDNASAFGCEPQRKQPAAAVKIEYTLRAMEGFHNTLL